MGGGEHVPLPAPRGSASRERRYRDDEVAAILARAAAREGPSDLPSPHDPTLADLMAAAEAAGLDPGEVRRAAALLPPPGGGGFAALALGAPDRREVAAVLEGAHLPPDTSALARQAEHVTGRRGKVVVSGPERFIWEERHLGGCTTISLSEEGGALEIRVTSDRAGHYLGLWFGGLVAWAALSALTPLGALPLLAQAVGFLAVPFLLARPLWVRADRRVRARLERVVLDLARAAEEGAGEHPGPGPAPPAG